MYRILINSIDYTNEVSSLPNVETIVNYNQSNRVWVNTCQSTFTGKGSLYTALFKRILLNQFNDILEAKVYKLDKLIFEGKVFLSDCTFDVTKNSVSFNILNKEWQSKIENNLNIPVPLDARYSKSSNSTNLIPIQTCVSINSGTYQLKKRDLTLVSKSNTKMWDINLVFKHIVNYISDNTILYESVYLSTKYLNTGKLLLTNGYNLRNATGTNCEVTFKKLFEDVAKLLNVVMYFSLAKDGITRVLKIEDVLSTAQSVVGLTLEDIQDVTMKFDQASYYSNITAGGTLSFQNNTEINNNYWYPVIEGASFGVENFAINTESNINNTLDLQINNFIYDHNKIEDCVAYDNIDYDKDLFLIVCNNTTPFLSDVFNLAPSGNSIGYYNEDLVNKKIIERHDVYGDIIKHHGLGSDTFLAYSGFGDVYSGFPHVFSAANPITSYYEVVPQTYPNDYAVITYGTASTSQGFDNNGNYTSNEYICPSTGYYIFNSKDRFTLAPLLSNFYHFYKFFTVKDSGGTITQQFVFKVKFVKFWYNNTNLHRIERELVSQVYNNAPEPWTGLDSTKKDGSGSFTVTNRTFVPFSAYDLINISFDINMSQSMYLDAGDKVTSNFVFVESDKNRYNNSNDGSAPPTTLPRFQDGYGGEFVWFPEYFGCNFSLNGGDVIINTRDGNGSLRRLNFKTELTDDQIRSIENNSQQKVAVNYEGNSFIGKIMSMKTNHKDNICIFDLKLD